jgi:chromosome segregation ATPase
MNDANEPELDGLLEQLEAEEQHLSVTRRRLHDRIAMFPGSTSRADVELRERELSAKRRELHRRIDELRARRNELRSQRPAG